MNKSQIIILCILLIGLPLLSAAQQTGFDILTVGPSTHALGMNDAATATLQNASAIYSNPANLAFAPSSSFVADYSLWIAGLKNSHGALNLRKNNRALAFGVLNSRADDFELRDRPGPSQGTFTASYLSLAAGYAHQAGPFAVGVTGQFLREQFFVDDASGYAINMGISSRLFDQKLTLSSVVRNLGKMNKLGNQSTPLPMEWRTGGFGELYTFSTSERRDFPITISATFEMVYPMNDHRSTEQSMPAETYFLMGLDLQLAETLSLYSGYRTDNTERPVSFGGSVALESISISYALVPFRTGYGNVHSVGISYRF